MNSTVLIILIIIITGLLVTFAIYIRGGFKKHRKHVSLNGIRGWYFISKKQAPNWLKHKWKDVFNCGLVQHGTITDVQASARGKYYEYRLVIVDFPIF